LQEALQNAISNRAELASLRLNTRAAMALTEATRADRRPQLALIARYEQGNPNTRNFPPEDQWQDDALIGAAVSWNLFDGGLTRARIAEARLQATKQQLQLEAQEEALLNFHHACSSLKTATHAESSAKRNLEVANTLWKNGSARHSDALDAEAKRTLTTAQRIAAESDVRIRRAALKHAMGDTP
jgi:outer membrane protein TolC